MLETVPEVTGYELAAADDDAFYAYVRDATTEPMRELFETVTRSPTVVIPPVEYAADGTASYSIVGPPGAIQTAVDRIPDPISVTVTEIGGLATATSGLESRLSDRQREAIEAALERGYYEVPREASHEVVADALDCAPSTAAEHLRKAESKLLRSAVGT